jgi:hypothetical protein
MTQNLWCTEWVVINISISIVFLSRLIDKRKTQKGGVKEIDFKDGVMQGNQGHPGMAGHLGHDSLAGNSGHTDMTGHSDHNAVMYSHNRVGFQ